MAQFTVRQHVCPAAQQGLPIPGQLMRRRAHFARGIALVLGALLIAAVVPPRPLLAQDQHLRDQISSLFIFGPGSDPLFLAGSADPSNPASIQAHGKHFIPSAQAENGSVISFIIDAVGQSAANVPFGSTSGGETFKFVGGVPVATSTSAGPIFAERAATLGKGRLLAGLSHSAFHLATLRGVDLRDLPLTFTHENANFAGCDSVYHDSCAKMGVPVLENDVINLRLALDINVAVNSLYLTYGLTDHLDVGAVIPVVSTSLRGQSDAQIQPFGPPPVAHFFSGTPQNPVLQATRTVFGDATGLGDVALRVKAGLRDGPRTSVAVLLDTRFPSGSTDDLLGQGAFEGRGVFIVTSRFGDLWTHANMGYLHRAGARQNDAVLGTVGFTQQVAPHVTLATDLVSELQVGDSKLTLPPPVHYDSPYQRVVYPTNIPNMGDDIVNGSFGFKITPRREITLIANALFPLNRGGVRPNMIYTGGVEANF